MEREFDALGDIIIDFQESLSEMTLTNVERLRYQERLKGMWLAWNIMITGEKPVDLYKL